MHTYTQAATQIAQRVPARRPCITTKE